MTPTLPPLADDSIEAAEQTMRSEMASKIANWLCAIPLMSKPPPPPLVEQAQRFLANVRAWSKR